LWNAFTHKIRQNYRGNNPKPIEKVLPNLRIILDLWVKADSDGNPVTDVHHFEMQKLGASCNSTKVDLMIVDLSGKSFEKTKRQH
jgi:hypothetical protein